MVKVKEVRTGKIWEFNEQHYLDVITSPHNKSSWKLVEEPTCQKISTSVLETEDESELLALETENMSVTASLQAAHIADTQGVQKRKPGRPKQIKQE